MRVQLRRWSAWAPQIEDREAWRAWSAAPVPLACEGVPDARFLPALLRRRCTPLSRIMLTAAFECCSEQELGEMRTLFASRHGSINESIGLLEHIARREKVSPARFSHTVHNAQAGLFSIAAGNRQASSSLSAMEDSFGCAWLEALAHLEREPGCPVLLVMGDVPLSETFAHLVEEPVGAYALALLLGLGEEGEPVDFELRGRGEPGDARAWPDALEFLRWLLAGERELVLGGRRHGFAWRRVKDAGGAHSSAR